ncbi:MAG: patatin-like phospholipase family protein [Methyloprofundus sp.]|uniref:CBASS cGAMP-activated phospholipase n=1 Tax=Thiomicrospira sp. TaxID=935 RepID=UPI001A042F1F|nr:patatin-like phospholipase family protein [Methyloprofundus sp.]
MNEKNQPFNILSIDGGGIRGVYAAHILSKIEKDLQIDLSESINLIAGTSTGSIIAAAVALKIPMSDIVKLYSEHGGKIFSRKWFSSQAYNSIYKGSNLRGVLLDVFGNVRLGEINKPLLIPASNIGNGGVHVFKSAYDPGFYRDKDVKVADAVLASCSAPTYFDPHKVDEYLLSDGGLWANNPTLVAIIDAKKRLNIDLDDMKILSVGTGHAKKEYGVEQKKMWGMLSGWGVTDFISYILSMQSESAQNMSGLLLEPDQILRLNFETDAPIALDDPKIIGDMLSKAGREFTYKSAEIKAFLQG